VAVSRRAAAATTSPWRESITSVTKMAHELAPDLSLFVHHDPEACDQIGKDLEQLLGITDLSRGKGRLGMAGLGVLGPGAMQHAYPGGEAALRSGPYDLSVLGDRIAAGGGRLQVGRVLSWRRYDGDPRDLLEMNRMVLDRMEPSFDIYEGEDNRIEGRVDIDPSAHIVGSVINGPVVIGPGAHIADAYIGPYTSIGRGVHVIGAEIERSIVGDGATIKNLGVRIEGSTVGPHARIFRDFGLPRAVRMHVGEGVELALD